MMCSILHCPCCYSNRKGRSNLKGHWGYRKPRRVPHGGYLVSFLRKASGPDGGRSRVFDDPAFRSDYPALAEFLFNEAWDDGTARQTGSLLLFVGDGALKACLNDREQGLVTFFVGASVNELMSGLDLAMQAGAVEWRRSSPPGRKPGGK